MLALGIAFVPFADAETLPEYIAETIVVTPSRFPQALSGQTASTTVITRQDIENSAQATLPELLAQQAGVGLRDLYGNAAAATVDLRGIGAAAAQNVLVLLDGRRLNDIDLSAIDWSALPLDAVERIEIVRGGSSVLHGAGAVAGVINIITRSPVAQTNYAGGKVQVGSFNTRNYQLSGNIAGDATGLRLTADHYRSDGWRDNNESEQTSANGDARWKHERGELVLKFGGAKHDTRLPGPRTVEADQGIDALASDPEGTHTPLDWAQRKSYQAGLSSSFAYGRHEAIVDLDYRNKQQRAYFDFAGWPEYKDADLDMLTFSPRVRAAVATGRVGHLVTVGADLQDWDYRLLTSNAPATIGTPINDVSAEQRSAGIYARDEMQLGETTRVTLGARYERFAIDARDTYDATAPGAGWGSGAAPDSQDESEHAWELGLNQRLDAEHALFARLARSFRFATVDEVYGFSPGYLHEFQFLRPQTSHDLQMGWEWGKGSNRLRTAAYYMRVRDEIHLDVYTAGVGNTNYSPLERYGIEVEANGRVRDVELHLAYSLGYAEFTEGTLDGVELDGNDVPLVPRHKVALGGVWHLDGQTRLAADVQYVSRQRMDNDEPNRFDQRIPSYTLVDLKLMRQIGNWQLSAAANNVLNEDYYTYAVHSAADLDRFNAYPLPGRHGWVSVEYAFR
jgi:iron complex outermembrane receptor protein